MSFKVPCPACGKLAQFSASDAGMTALCVACGARFIVPPDPNPPAAAAPQDPAAESAGFTTIAEVAADAPADPPPSRPPLSPAFKPAPEPITPTPLPAATPATSASTRRTTYAVIAAALCGFLAVVVVGCLISRHNDAAWQARTRDDVRAIKEKADALAADHKFQDAYETYAQIDQLVAGRAITDPDLRADIDQAHADRDAVSRLALAKTKEQYVTVTLPQATQPASTDLATIPSATTSPTATKPAPLSIRPRDPNNSIDLPEAPLTDEMIGRSIKRGVTHLLGQFRDGVLIEAANSADAYGAGADALCVYALLQASLATGDERLNLKGPFVHELIARMKAMPADKGPVTYARGIRATALAVLNRPEDRPALMQDLDYLLTSHVGGAYTYARPPKPQQPNAPEVWDNSNSQYGLLGVWSAAEVGAEVNSTYWQAVEEHWDRCQLPSGAWDYAGHDPAAPGRISMTLAGVASLFVTHDYLDARRVGDAVGRQPFSKPLALGLSYLEAGDNSSNLNTGTFLGYTLYGLERVGLASGFKYFGRHDWYREQATALLHAQHEDGSWGNNIETAYRLLFLARGRHPIVMNKLRYEGPWANRPRDVANLARFGSKELERPINWQVVPIEHDWTDWTDAPILYVATHKPVSFGPREIDRIRNYVEAGGMLFTQADGGAADANAWAEKLANQLFPAYPMADVPADHDLFSILYKVTDHPPLRYVTNGSRILMLHSPTDISHAWQLRQDKKSRNLFELGMNLFLYASGKADLRNRLSSPVIFPPGPPGGGRIIVARVKYDGNWDPEPAAWTRFGRYFQRETDVAVDTVPTEFPKLDPKTARFAHWTGTARVAPTDADFQALRKFVEGGGVLLVEPTGGRADFYDAARAAILKAFPDTPPQRVPPTDALLNQSGPAMDDLGTPRTRTYVKAKGLRNTRLELLSAGRGKVVLVPLDLTTGLLGCNTWGVLGYTPDYSLKLMKNILLWAETQVNGKE